VVSSWPDCWTSLQWDYFRITHTFLLCEGGKLGCRICQTVQTLGPNRSSEGSSTKRNLAYEWVNVKIDGAGNTKSARQKSLREKVRLHGESDAHKDAEKILSTRSKHFMQLTVIQQLGPSCRLPTASPGRWIGGRPPDMVASCDLSG